MHKLQANVDVGEQELSELRLVLERHLGVLLDTTTEKLTQALSEVLRSQPIASAGLLLERLRSSRRGMRTSRRAPAGWRDPFLSTPGSSASAGCRGFAATGNAQAGTFSQPSHPECWLLHRGGTLQHRHVGVEVVNCNGGGWSVNIVASDIRRQALQTAERGLYPQAALNDIPSHLVQPYFARVGDHLLVKPRLRNLVRFAPMNLAQPSFLGQFDCIFCMDVLPRFSTAQRTTLVQRLHLYSWNRAGICSWERMKSCRPQKRDFYLRSGTATRFIRRRLALAAKSGR